MLLNVKDLNVTFKTPDGKVVAVKDLNFSLEKGQALGIVGSLVLVKAKPLLRLWDF